MAAKKIALILATIVASAMAAEFRVGGSQGWTDPSKSNISYSSWALQRKYHVGDILVFNFAADSHSVLEVNRQAFDSCDSTNKIAEYTQSTTVVKLTTPGPHWFIEPSHCAQGQKFGIMVAQRRGGHHSAAAAPALPPVAGGGAEDATAPTATAPAPVQGDAMALATSSSFIAAAAAIAVLVV